MVLAPVPMLFEFLILHALYEMSLVIARFMGAGKEPVVESFEAEDL